MMNNSMPLNLSVMELSLCSTRKRYLLRLFPSPSPRPSPQGRGGILSSASAVQTMLGSQTARRRFSLSLAERAGVRGNGTQSYLVPGVTPGTVNVYESPRSSRVWPKGLE